MSKQSLPTLTTGAALSIELIPRPDQDLTLRFKPKVGEELVIHGILPRTAVVGQQNALREALGSFKAQLGSGLKPSFRQVSLAIKTLHERGRWILLNLFKDQTDKIARAVELCRTNCPGWQRPGWDEETPAPCLVEVNARIEDLVPMELIPLFGFEEPCEISDLMSLGKAVTSFLGFSCIVRRIIRGDPLPSGEPLDNVPKLPIQLFRHAGLTDKEEQFFQRQRALIDLDGPWPAHDVAEDFGEELVRNVLDPTKRFDNKLRHPPDQISHFTCHCDTNQDSTEDYTLKLAGTGWWPKEYTVRLRELRDKFSQYDYENRDQSGRVKRPLVFLNACGSSDVDPAGMISFPELFLRYHHRGFVGTETKVPDSFAAEFSQSFYRNFLSQVSLGQAIYRARWDLLMRYCNPLGILYSVYANPDLRVLVKN